MTEQPAIDPSIEEDGNLEEIFKTMAEIGDEAAEEMRKLVEKWRKEDEERVTTEAEKQPHPIWGTMTGFDIENACDEDD
jgi:hypothetical protein